MLPCTSCEWASAAERYILRIGKGLRVTDHKTMAYPSKQLFNSASRELPVNGARIVFHMPRT